MLEILTQPAIVPMHLAPTTKVLLSSTTFSSPNDETSINFMIISPGGDGASNYGQVASYSGGNGGNVLIMNNVPISQHTSIQCTFGAVGITLQVGGNQVVVYNGNDCVYTSNAAQPALNTANLIPANYSQYVVINSIGGLGGQGGRFNNAGCGGGGVASWDKKALGGGTGAGSTNTGTPISKTKNGGLATKQGQGASVPGSSIVCGYGGGSAGSTGSIPFLDAMGGRGIAMITFGKQNQFTV